jgi:FtsH-binding integral membrane protein
VANRFQRRVYCLPSLALAFAASAWSRDSDPFAAAGGCAVCSTIIFIPIIFIVLNIALLVWVARDAKARGMDSSILWMILVMFTSVLGLLLYIFARPQGNVVRCQNCGNNRLQASMKCPHCAAP